MAEWAPQQAGVDQILVLLREYLSPTADQRQTWARLQECSKFPEFNNYLAFILAQFTGPIDIRQSSGLLLKNNLKASWESTAAPHQRYIKAQLLPCLGGGPTGDRAISTTVGSIISALVGATPTGVSEWPELITALGQCLTAADSPAAQHLQDAALGALLMLCEDCPMQLDRPVAVGPAGGATGAGLLVPPLLYLQRAGSLASRRGATACLNAMLGYPPNALLDSLDAYTRGLFDGASSPDAGLKRLVCAGLVGLMGCQPQQLESQLPTVCEYVLACNSDPDVELALEAAEFWGALCEAELPLEPLRGLLPRLVPVLLRNMAYSADDDDVLAAEDAESEAPDKAADVRPFLAAGGRGHDVGVAGEDGGGGEGGEGDEGDDDDAVASWTLRKCSAAALDTLSSVFGDDILPHMLPAVTAALATSDWRPREAGILALGAVAKGCTGGLAPYLPEIVKALLPGLGDAHPLVRSITCWSLSRFAKWLAPPEDGGASGSGEMYLGPVLQGLLQRVGDRNKRVQEAACSAVATLAEEAGTALQPFAGPVLMTLGSALGTYGPKNLRLVYDALGALAGALGHGLADPQLVPLLLTPLAGRWTAAGDADRELPPLVECLTAVARALGPALGPFAPALLERSLRLLTQQATARQREATEGPPPSHPPYEKEVVVCILDLLGGLAEGLGASAQPLLAPAAPVFLPLLEAACVDPAPDVRQSGLALLGDLARSAHTVVLPRLAALSSLCTRNLAPELLRPENVSACNNAAWAMGELALVVAPEDLQPAALPLAQCLVHILGPAGRDLHRSLMENAAITLGRVGWRCPAPLAPHLPHFVIDWCLALRRIRDEVEKEQAFLGLCALLQANPNAALAPGAFPPLCAAVGSWRVLAHEGLRAQLRSLLHAFRQHMGANWDATFGALDEPLRAKLQQQYLS